MKKITDYYSVSHIVSSKGKPFEVILEFLQNPNVSKHKYYCLTCNCEIDSPRQLCGKYYCKTIINIFNKYS